MGKATKLATIDDSGGSESTPSPYLIATETLYLTYCNERPPAGLASFELIMRIFYTVSNPRAVHRLRLSPCAKTGLESRLWTT